MNLAFLILLDWSAILFLIKRFLKEITPSSLPPYEFASGEVCVSGKCGMKQIQDQTFMFLMLIRYTLVTLIAYYAHY